MLVIFYFVFRTETFLPNICTLEPFKAISTIRFSVNVAWNLREGDTRQFRMNVGLIVVLIKNKTKKKSFRFVK